MIIILSLTVVFLVSIAMWRKFRTEAYDCAWFMAPLIVGLILAFVLIGCVASRMETVGKIQRFNSTQLSLSSARENNDISVIELAAIQRDVVECNQWLAESQYWAANPLTSWFVPASVMGLKPIR